MFNPLSLFHRRSRAVKRIPIDAIAPNPIRLRRRMNTEALNALADSIHRHGQLTPVLVRPLGDGYELISGQRRIRALRLLGRTRVDAIVLRAGDRESAEITLTDNLQREPLHFLDEAEACRRILDDYPIARERLAASLSICPSALIRRLRLLRLPAAVRDDIRRYGLTERHARALLGLNSPGRQRALARQAAERRMSPAQLERRVSQLTLPRPPKPVVSRSVRDNRIIINAILDTVRELNHIGVDAASRVNECNDHIDVVVTIPVRHAVR